MFCQSFMVLYDVFRNIQINDLHLHNSTSFSQNKVIDEHFFFVYRLSRFCRVLKLRTIDLELAEEFSVYI